MPRSTQQLLQLIEDMARLEAALAELYLACSERFDEERGFWLGVERDEERHAQLIRALAGLVAAQPAQFRPGPAFDARAIKGALASVAGYTDDVRNGRLDRTGALLAARHLESFVVEADYGEIVGTDNAEFRETIGRIAEETRAHRLLFAGKVAQAARPA